MPAPGRRLTIALLGVALLVGAAALSAFAMSRVNLGLRSQYDELVEDATNVACRGATLFRNRGEGPQCVAGEQGWTKQVETSYIWPWDSRYYEHLLWFIFE